jgi:voltage-gated potassium channel
MKWTRFYGPPGPILFVALALSIPAFYLVLTGPAPAWRASGSLLYGLMALLVAVDLGLRRKPAGRPHLHWLTSSLDLLIFCGAAASAWPTDPDWSMIEWLLRLGYCGIVFIRLSMLTAKRLVPANLVQVLAIAGVLLAIAGAGFYWLEPKVPTYADGLWLAFITGATVGYGDIVLLGYAIFSVVTASIAALFVGEDEKRFEKELHADIRSLRDEIGVLRSELHRALSHAGTDRAPHDQ